MPPSEEARYEPIDEPLVEGRPDPVVQAWWLGRLEAAGWDAGEAARIARVPPDRLHQMRASPRWAAGARTVTTGGWSHESLQRLARAALELAVDDIRRPLPPPTILMYIRYVRESQGRERQHTTYQKWSHTHRKRTKRHAYHAHEAMNFVEDSEVFGSSFDLCCYLLNLPPDLVRDAAHRMAERNAAP